MRKITMLCLIGLMLNGCGITEPFVDSRREAGQTATVGLSRPDRVAVCYNAWFSDQEALQTVADAECAKNNLHAVYEDTDSFMCTITKPSVAYFNCR